MKEYGSKESWTKEYVIGESLFRSLSERRNSRPSSRIWKRPTLSKGKIQVLCSLRNGEILLEYENGVLVSYNAESEEFQQLMIHGLPKWFWLLPSQNTIHSPYLLSRFEGKLPEIVFSLCYGCGDGVAVTSLLQVVVVGFV
ncbi:unnamed protein product [Prunus brigantina]